MRSRVVRLGLLGVFVVVLGLALWTGYQAWRVNDAVGAAVNDATALETALKAGDQPTSQRALRELEDHTADASARTTTLTWRALGHLPVVGDDARGVRLAADVVQVLTADGLRPLVDETADLESFLPKEARIPVQRLAELQQPVADAREAFATASERLDTERPSSFVGPLRSKYSDLARRVRDTATLLDTASSALQIMPGMLGATEDRNYVLIFQNNAEVRSTGGLPGAFALIKASDGKLTLAQQKGPGDFTTIDAPIVPLSEAEEAIYGPQLGTFIQDANFTPDFPRTADLVKARWESEFPQRVDGVMAVDPIALSYVLGAVGPVQVKDVELTSENVVDELLHKTYLTYDAEGQDAFFRLVAEAVFKQVVSGAGDPQAILSALARAGDEHRIYVHSFDDREQEILTGRPVAGDLVTTQTDEPQVGVYFNDTTASKMSYYLRSSVRVDATSCSGDRQTLDGLARLKSVAPADAGETLPDDVTGGGATGLPPGSQLVAVRIYAPVGGTIERITLNGDPLDDVDVIEHDGRPVATTFLFLDPQQTTDLAWRMRGGLNQRGDISVTVTPSVQPGRSSSTVESAC